MPSEIAPPPYTRTGSLPSSKYFLGVEKTYPFRRSPLVDASEIEAGLSSSGTAFTVKYHGHVVKLMPSSGPPLLTIYEGGDECEGVIATARLKSSVIGSDIAEVKLYGEGSAAIQTFTIQKKSDKFITKFRRKQLEWDYNIRSEPIVVHRESRRQHLEAAPAAPGDPLPGDANHAPSSPTSLKGKFKKFAEAVPELRFMQQRVSLKDGDKLLATYEDFMPSTIEFTKELLYPHERRGAIEFKMDDNDQAFKKLMLAGLLLFVEKGKINQVTTDRIYFAGGGGCGGGA